MTWKIVPQEETIGKNTVLVDCKKLRYYPTDDGCGGVYFNRIKFPLFQVIIENDKGYRLRLKCNTYAGVEYPKFVIKHPDRFDYPEISVGVGKRRKVFGDTLTQKVRVPGNKEEYNQDEFEKRLTKMVGALMTEDIMRLFATKIGAVVEQQMAA